MRKHCILALLLLSTLPAQTKAQTTTADLPQSNGKCVPYYSRLLDASKADYALCADFKSNGSGIIAGYTTSNASGVNDAFIAALDTKGTVLWSRRFGGTGTEQINKIKATADNGFIAVGSSTSYSTSTASIAWLTKFDANGNITWSRRYDDGNVYGTEGTSVIQTTDGGYALSGIYANQAGVADAMIIKTDSLGKPQWAKRFNSFSTDLSWGLIQAGNNLLFTSFEYGQSASYYDGIVTKLSLRKGDIIWSHRFDIDNRSNNFSEIVKTGAGFAVYSLDIDDFLGGNAATTIVNISAEGSPLSLTKVSLNSPYNLGHGQNTATADGGHIITQYGLGTQNDLYIFKITSAGGLQWIKKVSGNGMRACTAVKQLSDGGYTFTGFSNNNVSGVTDSMNALLMRTDISGDIPSCNPGTETGYASTPGYYYDSAFVWGETADLIFLTSPVIVNSSDLAFGNKRICYSCTTAAATNALSVADAASKEATASFIVYPNPVKNNISIAVKGIITANAAITVNDMYGRVVLKEKLTTTMQQFSATHLAAGIYSATLTTTDGKRFTAKFVKE